MIRNESRFVGWNGKSYGPVSGLADKLPAWMSFPLEEVPTLPLTVAASGSKSQVTGFNQRSKGVNYSTPFEGTHFVFEDSTDTTAAANFTVKLTDVGAARDLMNKPIHIRCLAGAAVTPFRLFEPLIIPENGQVRAEFDKISGGASTMRLYLAGKQYFGQSGITDRQIVQRLVERKRYCSPYWMTPESVPVLTAMQTGAEYTIKVGMGNFAAFALMAVSTGAFAYQISEVTTRRALSNGKVHSTAGCGDANYPHLFDVPYIIPKGSQLRITLDDLSNGSNSVYLALAGVMYYVPIRDIEEAMRSTAVPLDIERD